MTHRSTDHNLQIDTLVSRIHRRRRWQESMRLAVFGLIAGFLFTLILVGTGRYYPLALPSILFGVGLLTTAIMLVSMVIYGWLRPQSKQVTAQLIDEELGLDERLSTAFELSRQVGSIPAGIIQAQLSDTIARLRHVEPMQAFPIRLGWTRLVIAILLVLLTFVILLMPNPQIAIIEEQIQTQAVIEAQIEQIETVREELLSDTELMETLTGQNAVETLDELLERLEQPSNSPTEALAALSEAEEELAALQDTMDEEATLNDLAQEFSQFKSTEELAEAIEERNMEEAKSLLDSMAPDFAQNPAQSQEMADALDQAAEQARQSGNDELASALEDAAEQLRQAGGDPQATQDALDQAAEAIASAGEGQSLNQEALENALGNIQQAQEQLAQQGQSGQGQQGQGQGQGQGQPRQQGQEQGQHQGGAGREDSTDPVEGLTSEQAAPDSMSTDNGDNEERLEDYESLAVPEHLGGEGGPLVKPDEQGAAGGVPIGDARINPDSDSNSTIVPYNEVYSDYNEAASEALDNSYIPLGMKDYVRDYFGALEPE
ncbi:hypothetical protein QUF64_12415 [Anaerolineales bacterium HSG6]|nr:hypothetical protein [Anaerolineales bacterium HSG6]